MQDGYHLQAGRVQVRRKGQPIQSRDFPSKTEAKAWARTVEGRTYRQPINTTLCEALKHYLREITPTKRGAKQERNRIKVWLKDPLAEKSLSDISRRMLAEWRDKWLAKGKAPTTIRNALTIISQVYKVAASEWGGLQGLVNSVDGLRLPKNRPGRDRRLEEGEEPALLEAAARICNKLKAAIIISLETSMRRGEFLAIEPRDIRNNIALVRYSKNGKARSVALSTRAQTAFKDWFDNGVSSLRPITLDKRWRRALKLAECGRAAMA
jgi:integrase